MLLSFCCMSASTPLALNEKTCCKGCVFCQARDAIMSLYPSINKYMVWSFALVLHLLLNCWVKPAVYRSRKKHTISTNHIHGEIKGKMHPKTWSSPNIFWSIFHHGIPSCCFKGIVFISSANCYCMSSTAGNMCSWIENGLEVLKLFNWSPFLVSHPKIWSARASVWTHHFTCLQCSNNFNIHYNITSGMWKTQNNRYLYLKVELNWHNMSFNTNFLSLFISSVLVQRDQLHHLKDGNVQLYFLSHHVQIMLFFISCILYCILCIHSSSCIK